MAAPHPLVAAVRRLEDARRLDGVVGAVASVVEPLDRRSWSGLLRSDLLGHALHPLLTDIPLGCWTSATLLDLRGRPSDRPASRTLVTVGLAAFGPTALTGWAEWVRTAPAERRVGVVHAGLNAVAAACYGVSLLARARGRHRLGTVSALAGASVVGASGYLGGHLVTARKVGSRDPNLAMRHALDLVMSA